MPVRVAGDGALEELTLALAQERHLIEELVDVLARQRAAVGEDDPESIDDSVRALGRVLLTLDEARRRRTAVVERLTGEADLPLADLESRLGMPLPPALAEERRAVRRAAEASAREVRVNQTVLRRALEAGDAYLQQLFANGSAPNPSYVPGTPRTEPRQGMLLNRMA